MADHKGHGYVEAAVDGIHAEAKKWYRLSDRMHGIFTDIMDVHVAEFSVADLSKMLPVYPVGELYNESVNEYSGRINGGMNQFSAMGDALNKVADWYATTDAKSAKSFDDIATS